ncbi:MAG: SAM-dependent methyltransferase [Alphaproteobacteria bacterium]
MNVIETHLLTQTPLTVETFMATCLYHPTHGYYTQGLNFTSTSHPKGLDFTTAPLLTPIFGACLATWVERQWASLGNPTSFHLLEAGPGNGALMNDILTTLSPACRAACTPHLVETSPTLTTLQQKTLINRPTTQWHTTLPCLLPPAPCLLIANELLDAFPIRQFADTTERTLTLTTNNQFAWSHPDSAITHEDSPSQNAWLNTLKTLPNLKAALLIDYGYTTPPTPADTLQALHRHTKVSPLTHLSEADLTAHVNFTHVLQTLGPAACTLTDLSPFLMAHNLLTHAESTITTPTTSSALHRLLHPAEMGSLFKVLEFKP